jgi:septum formation protein
MPTPPTQLILASTSRYRRELLARLRIPFESLAPEVAEDRIPGESPPAMAARLATLKAEAVATRYPDAVVIGSDQVASSGTHVLGKPGTAERAIEDLAAASGKEILFHTAVTVLCPDGARHTHLDLTRVRFRRLERAEITAYVALDDPLDCAGSFRSESLGVALFEYIDSRDPTALVGLPLIWVAGALRLSGLDSLSR